MCGGKHNQLAGECLKKNSSGLSCLQSIKSAESPVVVVRSPLPPSRQQWYQWSVATKPPATGPRYKIDHLESSKSFRQSLLVAANTTTTKPRRRSSGLGHIISICRGTHRPVAGSYVTSANMLRTQHSEMSERCCPRRRLLVWWMDGWGDYIGDR